MKIKQILTWIVGYEILTWLMIWMNSTAPRDPMDTTPPPSRGYMIAMTHVYSLVLVVFLVGIYWIVVRAWKASSHRRR